MDWLTKWFYERGYCASSAPRTRTQSPGKRRLRLTLYTHTSFDWIYNAFYTSKKMKRLPAELGKYLTPSS